MNCQEFGWAYDCLLTQKGTRQETGASEVKLYFLLITIFKIDYFLYRSNMAKVYLGQFMNCQDSAQFTVAWMLTR